MTVKMATVRGSARKALADWEDIKVIHEFKGTDYAVARITTQNDCALLGILMGHCASSHVADISAGLTHFFSVIDGDMVPHNTVHTKVTAALFNYRPVKSDGTPWLPRGVNPRTTYDSSCMTPEKFTPQDSHDQETMGLEQQLRYTVEEQKYIKLAAERYGPMGKDHPYKERMDTWNRKVNICKDAIEKHKNSVPIKFDPKYQAFTVGRRFLFQRRDTIVLSCRTKGGSRTKYDMLISQWLDTLPDRNEWPLPKALNAQPGQTLRDLRYRPR